MGLLVSAAHRLLLSMKCLLLEKVYKNYEVYNTENSVRYHVV